MSEITAKSNTTIAGIPVISINGVPTTETIEATVEGQAFINSPSAKEYSAWYASLDETNDQPMIDAALK